MKGFAIRIVVFVTLFLSFCAIQELQALTGWTGSITATSDNTVTVNNLTFGVNPSATDGFDLTLDTSAPFAPPEPIAIDTYFPCSDLSFPAIRRLSKDIRNTADTISWTVKVRADDVGFTFAWDVSGVPNTLSVKLNIGGGTIIDMRNPATSSHHFSATVGTYINLTIMVEPAPSVEVTDPTNVTKIKGGDNYTIKWNAGGTGIHHFHIQYLVNGGTPVNIATAVASGSREYLWTTPNSVNSSLVRAKVIAEDASNNSLASDESADFMIDSTPPVTNHTLDPAAPNGENNWYTSDVTVTLAAPSGLKTYYNINKGLGGPWELYGLPFTVSGSTVWYYSEDEVGNKETPKSVVIHIDQTKPSDPIDQTKPSDPTSVNDTGDHTFSASSLYVSWGASTDTESGIQGYQVYVGEQPPNVDDTNNIGSAWTTGTNYTFTGLNLVVDHTYYMAVRAKNMAGLWSTGYGRTDGITRVPSSIIVTEPKAGDRIKGGTSKIITWDYSGIVVHHFHPMYSTDGGATYNPVLPSTTVSVTSTYQCTWKVPSINSLTVTIKIEGEDSSNVEVMSGVSDNFIVDSTAPVTSISLNPLLPNGNNGWYTSDVVVTLTPTDAPLMPQDNLTSTGILIPTYAPSVDTFYNIDKGANGPWTPYTGHFTVPGPTTATGSKVWFYSVDNSVDEALPLSGGNKELTKSSVFIKIEKSAPVPVVTAPAQTGSRVQLSASWTYTPPASGLLEYKYCIGTAPGGFNVKDWTSTGKIPQVTATGLSLVLGNIYYFRVKAINNSSVESGTGDSIGTTVVNAILINAKAGKGGSIDPDGDYWVTPPGTNQTFNMDPDKGYEVSKLLIDGKSVSVKSSYTFTNVILPHTIEVKFSVIEYTIDAVAGVGGTISPSGSRSVDYGDDQTFTISPSTGYKISNVNVDGASLGAKTTHTFSNVKKDHNITATFAVTDHTITATAGANGTISPSGTVTVPDGTSKTFTMTPSNGYRVNEVKVDGSSVVVATTHTFTNVTSNHTIDVSFVPSTYTLTSIAGANGAISPLGATVVNYGAEQSYTITPAIGYHVAGLKVDGKSVDVATTYKFTSINSNHTIDASFAINTYTITASANSNGTISPLGAVIVNHGANQTFTMTPSQWYRVADVKVDGQSVGAMTTYPFTNVTSTHTIEAIFAIETNTITATAGIGGTISPLGAVAVNRGDNKSFSIAPSAGYHIADVKVDGQSLGAIVAYTFTSVTTNRTIDASFAINTYTITATVESGGTITPSGTITVNHGSTQTFTMLPNEGYKVSSLLVDGVIQTVSDSYTFTNIVSAHSILVKFEARTFTINTRSGLHGFIWPATMPMSKEMLLPVKYGETKLFTITTDAGYHVADLKVDGTSVGAMDTYTFTDVKADHVLEATFDVNIYKITASANGDGTISPSSDVSVNHGLNQKFTITPSELHHVADVKIDGTSVGALTSYEFKNVTSDHTIEAIFAIDTYIIKATASAGGTITPVGSVSVNHGADQEFAIASSDGYHLVDVKADGTSAGKVTTYKFTNVVVAHTIDAVFAIDTHEITAKAGANGTISPSGPANVNHGADQTFTITPSNGYHVLDVTVDGTSVGAVTTYKFTKVIAAHTIEATFEETIYIYTITASAGDGGTITPLGDVKVKKGDQQAFDMTPNEGYVIQDVRIDGQSMSTISKYVFMNVTSAHTISVKFRLFNNNVKQSALAQNYPNPFNPETWLPFQLKDDSDVTIKVYNVKGELVREMNLGHKASGSYLSRDKAAYWDGKNTAGEKVASGIYFYTIQAGKFTATRRMVISK